MWTKLYYKH